MKQGFTVVELIVVIVVIAVLVSLTALGYRWMLDDSRDAARRASVQQIVSAVDALKMQTDSTLMVGGYQSGGSLPVNGMCRYNGVGVGVAATTANWVFYSATATTYRCTLGSMLMSQGLLPVGFDASIPENDLYSTAARKRDAAMTLYRCDTTNKRWILYYYLKNPTSDDTASLDTAFNGCSSISSSLNTSLRNTLHMRAAVEIRL